MAERVVYDGSKELEIEALKKDEACALKVFMGASTGNMLVDDPKVLEGIFSRCPLTVVTHCEDTPTIKINEDAARAKYGEDVPAWEHPNIRSAEACYKSTELAVGLAKKHGTQLHVLHLTTARELHNLGGPTVAHLRVGEQQLELVGRTLHVTLVPEGSPADSAFRTAEHQHTGRRAFRVGGIEHARVITGTPNLGLKPAGSKAS